MIRLGACHQEYPQRKRGDSTGRDLPWGVSSANHRLGIPLLASYTGETSPSLAGWELLELTMCCGNLDSACMHVHTHSQRHTYTL